MNSPENGGIIGAPHGSQRGSGPIPSLWSFSMVRDVKSAHVIFAICEAEVFPNASS